MRKEDRKTQELCITAVITAMVFVVTRFIQIPIPLGYFNIGNTVILLACLLIPEPYGIFAGSVGSALADLLSYPIYAIPTLLIKFLMPLVFYRLTKKGTDARIGRKGAAAIATLIPLFGYTVTGMIIYGSVYTGLSQFPGLVLEYAANLVLFSLAQVYVVKMRGTARESR
jgi:uncharacterized membrane protein